MARNSEKAQSMLYRFREQQAVDMGMGNRVKGDRRPRMASSVTSLRDCERWRGDILRDISRKVSKIQDSTLNDYEIRDLNDEINNLMREKRHWENQIVSLGGANYKRAQSSMLDDDGKEVPGTRGYKYFGRARELPGVKDMFTKGATQASEESARNASFQMFRNQGPEYYGDADELDASLAEDEDRLAREDWEEAVAEAAEILSLSSVPELPYPVSAPKAVEPRAAAAESSSSSATEAAAAPAPTPAKGKRKAKGAGKKGAAAAAAEAAATAEDGDVTMGDDEASKRIKTHGQGEAANGATAGTDEMAAAMARQAAVAASFLNVLDPESLKQPKLPTRDEMAQILLDARKRALMEEYGVTA